MSRSAPSRGFTGADHPHLETSGRRCCAREEDGPGFRLSELSPRRPQSCRLARVTPASDTWGIEMRASILAGILGSSWPAQRRLRSRSASSVRLPDPTRRSAPRSRTAPVRQSTTSTSAGGINGQKLIALIGDDAGDPKQGVSWPIIRQRRRENGGRSLQFGRLDPGLRRLSRRRHHPGHPGLDEREVHRARHVEHLPHLRP